MDENQLEGGDNDDKEERILSESKTVMEESKDT